MAVPHMKIKTGGAGKAAPHAEYIAREGEYAKRLETGEKLEYTEHGNMPAWAQHNPAEFWKAADLYERKNGSTYREFEIALPRELDEAQRIELLKDWIKQEIGDKHPYSLAIHNPKAMDGGEQPHAHVMFNERRRDSIARDPDQYFRRYNSKHPERGGAQKLNTGKDHATRKQEIKEIRNRWENLCNQHLERAGQSIRVNLKSLKDQGVSRPPERKYLPSEARDPQKRAELTEFRHSHKNAQNRATATLYINTGIGSTLDRFEAYKRNQRDLEPIQKAVEAEKAKKLEKMAQKERKNDKTNDGGMSR